MSSERYWGTVWSSEDGALTATVVRVSRQPCVTSEMRVKTSRNDVIWNIKRRDIRDRNHVLIADN